MKTIKPINRIKELELDYSFSDRVISEIKNLEEQLLKNLLSSFLGRPAVDEDGKDCTRVFEIGVYDTYLFKYKNSVLGTVTTVMKDNNYFIEFKPIPPTLKYEQ